MSVFEMSVFEDVHKSTLYLELILTSLFLYVLFATAAVCHTVLLFNLKLTLPMKAPPHFYK